MSQENVEDLSCLDLEPSIKRAKNNDDAHDNDRSDNYDIGGEDDDDVSTTSSECSECSDIYEILGPNVDICHAKNGGSNYSDEDNDDIVDRSDVSQEFLQEIERKETNEKLFEFIQSNNLKSNSPDFGTLPHLAINNIYKYLDYGDIRIASTTCRSWRSAAQNHLSYSKNTIIKLNNEKLKELIKFSKEQQSEMFIYKNFYLENIDSTIFIEFGKLCFEKINELTLKNIEFFENNWIVLNLLKNLKELTLIKCKFVKFDKIKHENSLLSNIEKLTINKCEILENTKIVIIFIKQFQNLKYLKIINTQQSVRSSKPKRLLKSLSNNFFPYSLNLKEFHYYPNLIDFNRCNSIKLPIFNSDISLTKLTLEGCHILQETRLIQILTSQTNLIHLNLSTSISVVNNKVIEIICNNLKNLKELILQNSVAINNSGLKNLEKLKNTLCLLDLRYNFHREVQFTISGILNGLAKEENLVLKKLYLRCVCNREKLIKVFNNLPNLELLNLHTDSIDDDCLEFIVKKLRNLRYLHMRCSKKLNSSLSYLSKLYHLRHLSLRYISKVNYFILIENLKLKDLKRLELYNCYGITYEGLEKLSKNSPSIEYLSLCYCHEINYDTVILILKNFHRLKVLEITRSAFIENPRILALIAKKHSKTMKILLK